MVSVPKNCIGQEHSYYSLCRVYNFDQFCFLPPRAFAKSSYLLSAEPVSGSLSSILLYSSDMIQRPEIKDFLPRTHQGCSMSQLPIFGGSFRAASPVSKRETTVRPAQTVFSGCRTGRAFSSPSGARRCAPMRRRPGGACPKACLGRSRELKSGEELGG